MEWKKINESKPEVFRRVLLARRDGIVQEGAYIGYNEVWLPEQATSWNIGKIYAWAEMPTIDIPEEEKETTTKKRRYERKSRTNCSR